MCAARLTLRFFIPLSYCFSLLAEETSQKAWLERSHFEEWVPVMLRGCSCCPGEIQRDVNSLYSLPVCQECGCHLFSPVSTNHLILLWCSIGLEDRGSTGTGLMSFGGWTTASVAQIAFVSSVRPVIKLWCCICHFLDGLYLTDL